MFTLPWQLSTLFMEKEEAFLAAIKLLRAGSLACTALGLSLYGELPWVQRMLVAEVVNACHLLRLLTVTCISFDTLKILSSYSYDSPVIKKTKPVKLPGAPSYNQNHGYKETAVSWYEKAGFFDITRHNRLQENNPLTRQRSSSWVRSCSHKRIPHQRGRASEYILAVN